MNLDASQVRSGLRTCRRALWAAAAFSLPLNLLMLTVPLYMTSIYDRVLSSRSGETLLMLSILALGALALAGILEVVRQLVLTRAGARLETALGGPALIASLHAAPGSGPDVQGLRDLAQLRQFVSSPLVTALFDAPAVPIYLALVFLIHPYLGALSVSAAIVLILVSFLNQRLTRSSLAEAARQGIAAGQKAQAQMRDAHVLRAMGMVTNAVRSWGEANARAMIACDDAARRASLLTGVSRTLRLLVQIAVLGCGAYLVLADASMSAGIIFAASIISARALAPIDQLIGGWGSFAAALQCWARIKALLAAAPAEAKPMALPDPVASVSVERLVYRPGPKAEPIIRGISFAVAPGEAVGLIGPSGAGKSTLAQLLVGVIQPSGGLVRIGGDDLAHWSAEALGPHIGYLPQDVELFPVSVAQNIARLSSSPDPEKVIAAAKLANCHELIQALPNGYNTLLGPQGHPLSGGQRQRIALARAFYGPPKVVVLDEPNASLDSDGEQALIAALKKAQVVGITSIVITQRTSIVPALTHIMVLRNGCVEAFGPREEILQQQIRTVQQPTRTRQGSPELQLGDAAARGS